MNLMKWSLLLPTFALTFAFVGCGDSSESTVVPASPTLEVEESYEEDSYGDTTDESAN